MGKTYQRVVTDMGELGHNSADSRANLRRRFEMPEGYYAGLAVGNLSDHDKFYVEGVSSIVEGALNHLPGSPTELDYMRLPSFSVGAPLTLGGH